MKLTEVERYSTKDEYVAACDSSYVLEKVRYRSEKEFGVIIFPGGNHTLQQHRVERDHQVVEFFRRHLVK